MKNKYYTPKIEEFHVGFEFEVYEDYDVLPEKSWHKETYPSDTVSQFYLNEGLLRVKSLDQEDIESLGFEYSGNNLVFDRFTSEKETPNGFYYIFIHDDIISIESKSKTGYFTTDMFNGTIKNKSELKNILKMIGYDMDV